uniref:Uncharacterized protein n=1 Tax=Panagrolaimus sp. PS1159 TaxID=55785 RepID=A0AC35G8K1_9BILA
MLFFLILATFLPFVSSEAAASFDVPYTSFPTGCHNFGGRLSCGNGNQVLPNAKVILWEKDPITADDKLAEVSLEKGLFKMHICATDFPTPDLELYFQFLDVCEQNEKKHSGILKENVFLEYVIYDKEKFAHSAINDNLKI